MRNRPDGTIRVGGACGYWGESALATPQLLGGGDVDFLIYDYLAEITMAILARARQKDAALGYAVDFVTEAMGRNLDEIAARKVKVISNAGGLNPQACGRALEAAIAARGLALRVAVIDGDDLSGEMARYGGAGARDMFSGAPCPAADRFLSANAYFGAFPIAAALDRGADIVVTGRCVDSALTLGACIHAFAWQADAWDLLAAGSLAGHIIECGPQASGGNFTDWRSVAGSIAEIGYPIAEIDADGAFTVTKPPGTGGMVSTGTVSEQLVYEIGDPQSYVLPDVICDFSGVFVEEAGGNCVRVRGARGRPAPAHFKVCATYADGYRAGQYLSFYGEEAGDKADAFAAAAFARAARTLDVRQFAPFSRTSVEVLGAARQFGTSGLGARDVVVKLAAAHEDARALEVLLKETAGLGLSAPPGLCGFNGGRPKAQPIVRLFSFLAPKRDVTLQLSMNGVRVALDAPEASAPAIVPPTPPAPASPLGDLSAEAPLVRLAWARSGDKGDNANIGVVARRPAYLPFIWAALSEARLRAVFAHVLAEKGRVERYFWPGVHGLNVVLHEALDGGGAASLRNDPQGKGFSQILLSLPVPISRAVASEIA